MFKCFSKTFHSLCHSCVMCMGLYIYGSDIPNTKLYQIIIHDTLLPHQLWLLTGLGCFQWAWKASPHFSQISNSVTKICQQQWATTLSKYPALPHKVTQWGEQCSLLRESCHFKAAINSLLHYQVFKSPSLPIKLLMFAHFSEAFSST